MTDDRYPKEPGCASCAATPDGTNCGGHWRQTRSHTYEQTRPKVSLDVYDSAHLAERANYGYEDNPA